MRSHQADYFCELAAGAYPELVPSIESVELATRAHPELVTGIE